MNFDFQDPHTAYVVAAYTVAALGYGAIVLHTFLKWCRIKKMEKQS